MPLSARREPDRSNANLLSNTSLMLFAPACSRLRKNGGHTSPRLRVAPNKKTGFNCFSQLRNAAGGANGSITLSIVRLCTNVHGWAQLAPLLLSPPIYPNKILCSCATGCTLSSQNRANACKAGLARLQRADIEQRRAPQAAQVDKVWWCVG